MCGKFRAYPLAQAIEAASLLGGSRVTHLEVAHVLLTREAVHKLLAREVVRVLLTCEVAHVLLTKSFDLLSCKGACKRCAESSAHTLLRRQSTPLFQVAHVLLTREAVHKLLTREVVRVLLTKSFDLLSCKGAYKRCAESSAHTLLRRRSKPPLFQDAHELLTREVAHVLLTRKVVHELLTCEVARVLLTREVARVLLTREATHALLTHEVVRVLLTKSFDLLSCKGAYKRCAESSAHTLLRRRSKPALFQVARVLLTHEVVRVLFTYCPEL